MNEENSSSIQEDFLVLKYEGNNESVINLRTELGRKVREILIRKRLRQRELAVLLSVRQPEVSHLLNGHFDRFTLDKLILFLGRLGWMIKIQISPRNSA